jgi:hypothetical protein
METELLVTKEDLTDAIDAVLSKDGEVHISERKYVGLYDNARLVYSLKVTLPEETCDAEQR